MEKKFPLCDFFGGNDVIHCASLVITPNLIEDSRGRTILAQPTKTIKNGTLTFVEADGKVYGITCWHVIQAFRDAEKQHGKHSHTMRTMVDGFYVVGDRFVRPSPQVGQPPLDIAIREINPEHPKAIGKKPLCLDSLPDIPDNLQHAVAVGFPTNLKHRKDEGPLFHRISMPNVTIVAELNGETPTQRFSMFSELDGPPETTDFSGASGGPIYWSTKDEYGILGIIYESVAGSELLGGNAIHVSGELATPEVIKMWIYEYHRVAGAQQDAAADAAKPCR